MGEGLTEAEIVSWKVKVGDTVEINEVVVEIETAKSLVELPSPYAGVVTALLVPEGATVPVGTPIIAIGDPSAVAEGAAEDGDASADDEPIDLSNPGASRRGEGESLVGRAPAERAATRRVRRKTGEERAGVITAHADVMDSFNIGGTQQHEHAQHLIETLFDRARGGARARRRARARRGPRRSPSRRSASWPRTAASTCPP